MILFLPVALIVFVVAFIHACAVAYESTPGPFEYFMGTANAVVLGAFSVAIAFLLSLSIPY